MEKDNKDISKDEPAKGEEPVAKVDPTQNGEPKAPQSQWGELDNKPPTPEQIDEMKRVKIL